MEGVRWWCRRAHDFLLPVLEGVSVVAAACSDVLHSLSRSGRGVPQGVSCDASVCVGASAFVG